MARSRILVALAAAAGLAIACDLTTFLPEIPTAAPLFGDEPALPWATLDFQGGLIQGPVGIGQALTIGNLEVRVNDFLRPANDRVLRAEGHPELEPGEEFALVDVSTTCHAEAGEVCNVSEFNFTISNPNRRTYAPELSMFLSGLQGIFEGGELAAGDTRSGYLVFILIQGDSGLELSYSPTPGGFGGGRFTLP